MGVRLVRVGAGALVLGALALSYPRHGGVVVEPAPMTWGDAPEPVLHRLLRDLVREAREQTPRTPDTRDESQPHERTSVDSHRARLRPPHARQRADRVAGPSP